MGVGELLAERQRPSSRLRQAQAVDPDVLELNEEYQGFLRSLSRRN